ncbi:hypothetical protein [Burkholderia glumae]|uniref:hypothetical protein n=1 Tax=Burkholderia glumae TaxID=337 RepID=UPI002151B95D|nr:hypothetical protein [Burkholderia glumae]
MLEKTVEAYLVERVRALGGEPYKFTSPARASVPDRIVVLPPGRVYFIEVKRPGGKLTRGQEREHERLRRLGADVRVLDSIGAINAFVNEVQAVAAPVAPVAEYDGNHVQNHCTECNEHEAECSCAQAVAADGATTQANRTSNGLWDLADEMDANGWKDDALTLRLLLSAHDVESVVSMMKALQFIDSELTEYLEGMPADETSRKLRDVARDALNVERAAVSPATAEPFDYAAIEREHFGDPDKRTGIYAPATADELAAFLVWWTRDVPEELRRDWINRNEHFLRERKACEALARAWEGWQARASQAAAPADAREPSPTAGMNLGERIKHVGGRENAAGYIEFGSVAAVGALIKQVIRDLPRSAPADAGEAVAQWQTRVRAAKTAAWVNVTEEDAKHVMSELPEAYEVRALYERPAPADARGAVDAARYRIVRSGVPLTVDLGEGKKRVIYYIGAKLEAGFGEALDSAIDAILDRGAQGGKGGEA